MGASTGRSRAVKELEAKLRSAGGWGEVADDSHGDRYASAVKSRRKCLCGCGGKVTHQGHSNGVALMAGCEMFVRRWVRQPDHDYGTPKSTAAWVLEGEQ